MKNSTCSRLVSWFPAIRIAIPPATSGHSRKFLGRAALACAAAIALTSLSAGAADYSNWLKNLSASGDPTGLYSHSKVKVATSGNYVHVAWYASLIASPYSSAIFYTRSTDGGLTFETPRILASGANGMVTFDATFNNLAADGAFVHIIYREGWPEKLQYLRSTDNGATFAAVSTLSTVSSAVGAYYRHAAYLTAGNGKVAVVWSYESNSNGYGAFNCSYSSNNGASFATTTTTNTLYSFYVEDAVRSGDYVYVLTSTGDAGGGYGYYTGRFYLWASWDGGATFKPPVKVTVPTTDATPVDMVCKIQNGIYAPNLVASGATVNIAWINQDTYINNYNKTYTLRTCRSTDGGQTLNPPVTLHSFAAGDGSAVNAGMETISGNGSNIYITTVLSDAPAGTYTWRSTDAGATWGAARQISSSGTLPITKADPSDATRVHTVNSSYYQSTDSGATFDGGVNPHTPVGDWSLPQMTVDAAGVVHYAANSGYYGEIFYRRLGAPPQPGPTNKALACVGDGTKNDNMQVAASPDLNFTTAMTVEFWARRDTDDMSTSYFQPLVGKKRLSGTYGSYGVGAWSSSQIYARIVTDQSADSSGSLLFSGVAMAKGVWYHVALTYDASLATDNVKLFVNGVQKAQANLKGTVLTDTMDSPLKVGNTSGTGGFSIDELRLWNTPLAGTDIAANMNFTRAGAEAGLVAYYDFNDTTMDITGRGNDGILMFRETYTASAASVTVVPTTTITMPAEADSFPTGATIDLVAAVDTSGGATVTGVEFYDNGTLIGQAQRSLLGEWSFPDGSHISVLGIGVTAGLDYNPPNPSVEQMYWMDGGFLTQDYFQGTFGHWDDALGHSIYGNARVQFSFGADGTLDANISGDSPLGTRSLSGAPNQYPSYILSWTNAAAGAHTLTTRAYYATGSYVTSSPVNITVIDSTTRVIGISGNLAFGNVKVGSSANATMTVSNTGNAPLAVSSISYPAGFTGNWASGTIAAGSSQDVTVTFSPSAAQAYSGTITVNSDSTSGTSTIAASGQGTQTPYEAWQAGKFTAGEIAGGLSAPAADFDHDGLSNLLEYAFAKNPKVADLTGIVPNVSGNKMQISFPCLTGRSDITYTVQASSNLSTWADIAQSVGGATTVPINSSGCAVSDTGIDVRTVTVTEAAAFTGKRFLRVKVTSP
ncbi:MAG: choice-of-anchor D domain-containing protein [Verrucomicrobiota bacterium]